MQDDRSEDSVAAKPGQCSSPILLDSQSETHPEDCTGCSSCGVPDLGEMCHPNQTVDAKNAQHP